MSGVITGPFIQSFDSAYIADEIRAVEEAGANRLHMDTAAGDYIFGSGDYKKAIESLR
jgi:pentose-5-phosphate-3-epimerase